ncbi:MAG: helix-turn-helix domain-containing protein [Lachnospirales bacterium]
MEEKLYTIDEVASMLKVHHKTIRRHISSGVLKANKVGKQWRISGHELSVFLESENFTFEKKDNEISFNFTTRDFIKHSDLNVSTVIDINNIDFNKYNRVSNSLLAVMNSTDPKMKNSTINIKYSKDSGNLKIIIWGNIDFTKEFLDFVTIFLENNNEV